MAGNKMREDQLQAVWFAAGTAAFIACIERAVVVSLFAHWRVWAFLALNLLLLAILFTSKSQIQSSETDKEDDHDSEIDKNKKKQEEFSPVISANDNGGGGGGVDSEIRNNVGEDVKEEGHDEQISKEELNQRAEAFIAMFRQHLVSDAKSFQTSRKFTNSRLSQSKKYIRT